MILITSPTYCHFHRLQCNQSNQNHTQKILSTPFSNIVPVANTIRSSSFANPNREGPCMHVSTRFEAAPSLTQIVRDHACNATLVNKISLSLTLALPLSSPPHLPAPPSHFTRGGTLPSPIFSSSSQPEHKPACLLVIHNNSDKDSNSTGQTDQHQVCKGVLEPYIPYYSGSKLVSRLYYQYRVSPNPRLSYYRPAAEDTRATVRHVRTSI